MLKSQINLKLTEVQLDLVREIVERSLVSLHRKVNYNVLFQFDRCIYIIIFFGFLFSSFFVFCEFCDTVSYEDSKVAPKFASIFSDRR